MSLPIGLYPAAAFPRVRINIDAGSQPATQMVLQTTQPIEQAVRAVPGVVDVLSTTSRGSAQITVDFAWGTDMTSATLGVNAAMAQNLLQPAARVELYRAADDADRLPLHGLRADLAERQPGEAARTSPTYQMVPLLSAVPGIARVQVQGGDTGEVEVEADPRASGRLPSDARRSRERACRRQHAAIGGAGGGS